MDQVRRSDGAKDEKRTGAAAGETRHQTGINRCHQDCRSALHRTLSRLGGGRRVPAPPEPHVVSPASSVDPPTNFHLWMGYANSTGCCAGWTDASPTPPAPGTSLGGRGRRWLWCVRACAWPQRIATSAGCQTVRHRRLWSWGLGLGHPGGRNA